MDRNKHLALAEKIQGNEFFSSGDFRAAIEHYSRAIKLDPRTAVFFSNRAFAQIRFYQEHQNKNYDLINLLQCLEKAVADGWEAIRLDSQFFKAYVLSANALHARIAFLKKHSHIDFIGYSVQSDIDSLNRIIDLGTAISQNQLNCGRISLDQHQRNLAQLKREVLQNHNAHHSHQLDISDVDGDIIMVDVSAPQGQNVAPAAPHPAVAVQSTTNPLDSSGGSSPQHPKSWCSALLIGNSKYISSPLGNPVNDARALDEALRKQYKFDECELLLEQDWACMRRAVIEFCQNRADIVAQLRQNSGSQQQARTVSWFFFSGHGSEMGGDTFLYPVSHSNADKKISLKLVVDEITNVDPNGISIFVLDCCRANGAAKSETTAAQSSVVFRGNFGTGVEVYIAFATSPGSYAYDGLGSNSPYTASLLQSLRNGKGKRLEDIFKDTRRLLVQSTR